MKTEEKNRGFRFERHNLSKDEIVDVLFYKAKEFYNTKENSMPSSLVIDEIIVGSFGDHYCNDTLYIWISLHRTVESALIALLGEEMVAKEDAYMSELYDKAQEEALDNMDWTEEEKIFNSDEPASFGKRLELKIR